MPRGHARSSSGLLRGSPLPPLAKLLTSPRLIEGEASGLAPAVDPIVLASGLEYSYESDRSETADPNGASLLP
eukprot:7867740-Pyramimonas_sp.AAC.1